MHCYFYVFACTSQNCIKASSSSHMRSVYMDWRCSTFTRSYSILFLDTLTHARIRWIIFPWVITRSRIVMFKVLWNNIQTRLLRRNIIHSLPTFHLHTALCYLHSGFVGNLHARQRRRESLLWGYALMQLFPICLQRTNGCDDGERGLA